MATRVRVGGAVAASVGMLVLGIGACGSSAPGAQDAGRAFDGGAADGGGAAFDGGGTDAGVGDGGATSMWQSRASLPGARQESAVAALGDAIYVVGGLDASGRGLTESLRYDVATNQWSTIAPYPFAVDHAAAVAVGGLVVVMGGSEGFQPGSPDRRVYAYDPVPNEWRRRADMPRARWAPAAATLGGVVYLGGGLGEATTEILSYDVPNDRWTTLANVRLSARDHLGAAEVGGLVYFVGGRTSGNLRVIEALDPQGPSLAVRAQMPTPRGGIAATAALGHIVVPGGEVFGAGAPPNGVYDSVDLYDVARDRWRQGPTLITARHGHGMVTVGNVVFAVAGGFRAGFGASDTIEALDLDAYLRAFP